MADYSELKAAIRAAIYDNTEQAITGEVLQDILVEMVDALGVPEGGIPASELTQAVQQALEKALSAYQKPQGGIPAGDIADGVIPDVSQFITKTVTDLVHYYTKEETYTQQQVNDLIGAISQFHYEIYASLGDITSPASNVLYLIGPTGSGSDQYEEYVYANGAFTKIGDTSIDVSGYLRYTPQTLTEEEKAQARRNIGATAPEVFWAEYGVTTASEVIQAKTDGKIVAMYYDNKTFLLSFIQYSSGNPAYCYFFAQLAARQFQTIYISVASDQWVSGGVTFLQTAANKVNTLSGNETNTDYYPSTKAVADALGKMGVVSQTQTWTGSNAAGWDYTMSNIVRGLIPQSFIDMATAHTGVVFNDSTGYFELNGLTDISYQEMATILSYGMGAKPDTVLFSFTGWGGRTTLPYLSQIGFGALGRYNMSSVCRGVVCEVIVMARTPDYIENTLYGSTDWSYAFQSCQHLKKVIGEWSITANNQNFSHAFDLAYSLEYIKIRSLNANISFYQSSRLTLASVVYLVDNAANTSAITITLHATAYARCQADTTEYTYNGQTYTGILAYAAAKNITIASA